MGTVDTREIFEGGGGCRRGKPEHRRRSYEEEGEVEEEEERRWADWQTTDVHRQHSSECKPPHVTFYINPLPLTSFPHSYLSLLRPVCKSPECIPYAKNTLFCVAHYYHFSHKLTAAMAKKKQKTMCLIQKFKKDLPLSAVPFCRARDEDRDHASLKCLFEWCDPDETEFNPATGIKSNYNNYTKISHLLSNGLTAILNWDFDNQFKVPWKPPSGLWPANTPFLYSNFSNFSPTSCFSSWFQTTVEPMGVFKSY